MDPTAIKRELSELSGKIDELEHEIKEQQSKYVAALKDSEPEALITAYKEGKERLIANKHERIRQLAALQAQLTSPVGAPCCAASPNVQQHTRWRLLASHIAINVGQT